MRLFDHTEGVWVDLPDAEAARALRSGRYTAEAGTRIPIISQGRAATIRAEDAASVFSDYPDISVEPAEQRSKRRFKQRVDEDPLASVKALGAGIARSTTLGASDVLLRAVGGERKAEELQALKEVRPGLSLTGELTGAVAPAVLSAGTGLVGTAARFTPAGAAARLGAAAEFGAARALGVGAERTVAAALAAGKFSPWAKKAIAQTGGAAVEGALFGGGVAISEAALGDVELTAEHLLSGVTTGAMWGAGAALGVTAAGAAAKGSLRAASIGVGKGKKALGDLYENLTGTKPSDGLAQMYNDAVVKYHTALGKDPPKQLIKQLLDNPDQVKAAAKNIDDIYDDVVGKLRAPMDDGNLAMSKLQEQSFGERKVKNFQRDMKRGNETDTFAASHGVLVDIQKTTAGIQRKFVKKLPFIRELEKRVIKLRTELLDSITAPPTGTRPILTINDQLYRELDEIKRDVGKWVEKHRYPKTVEIAKAVEEIRHSVRGRLEAHLESTELWGKIGNTQKELNAHYSAFLRHQKNAESDGWFHVGSRPEGFEKDLFVTNLNRLKKTVKKFDAPNNERIEFIKKHYDLQEAYADAVLRNIEAPEMRQWAERAKKAAQRFRVETDDMAKRVLPINQMAQLNELAGHGSQLGGVISQGALGWIGATTIGVVPTMGLIATFNALAHPGSVVRSMALLKQVSNAVTQRVSAAAGAIVGRANRAGQKMKRVLPRRALTPLTVWSAQFGDEKPAKRGTRAEAFLRHKRQLDTIVADPVSAQERLTTAVGNIRSIAPSVAETMVSRTMSTAIILQAKAAELVPDRNPIARGQAQIPETAIIRYERLLNAASNPLYVPIKIESNAPLSKDEVDVWAHSWPKMFEQLQIQFIEHSAQLTNGLGRTEASQLAVLFGVAISPEFTPAFVQRVQARLQPDGPQDKPGIPGSVRRTDITLRARKKSLDTHQTGAQRLEDRAEV